MILFLKILIPTIIVVSLVFVSERNQKLGGLITGLPLGTGIMILFFGLEQGVDFVINAVPYGISGMVSTISFGIGFYIFGNLFKNSRFYRVVMSFMGGLLFYLSISFILSNFSINFFKACLIFIAGYIIGNFFYTKVKIRPKTQIRKFSIWILLFRILFVVMIVLIITGLAKIIGPKWSGLIASFPTILSPLLIILSYTYKDNVYPNLLKHLAYSVLTIFLFYLLILWLFPIYGVVIGILLAYALCVVFVMLLSKLNLYGKLT